MSLFSREQTRGLLYLIPILLLIVMLTYVIERDRDTTESALLAKKIVTRLCACQVCLLRLRWVLFVGATMVRSFV